MRPELVGGAGSLEVAPGLTLSDSGKLPPQWLPIATAHALALEVLRSSSVNWTYLAPAAYFDPGERTGRFRLGKNDLIVDTNGDSRISMEDYAIAMVDELEIRSTAGSVSRSATNRRMPSRHRRNVPKVLLPGIAP